MNKIKTEKILCVPRSRLFATGEWEGFRPSNRLDWFQEFLDREGKWMTRHDVEESPYWKQIIPQIAVAKGGKLFVHQIPETGGEPRLHKKWPIFVGGHMDCNSLSDPTDLEAQANRELVEEVNVGTWEYRFLGFVNTEESAVSSVHFGVVLVAAVSDGTGLYESADEGVAYGAFLSPTEIRQKQAEAGIELTEWSELAFDAVAAAISENADQ